MWGETPRNQVEMCSKETRELSKDIDNLVVLGRERLAVRVHESGVVFVNSTSLQF